MNAKTELLISLEKSPRIKCACIEDRRLKSLLKSYL